MTDPVPSGDAVDPLQLHDHAAGIAAEAVENVRRLQVEGIPQRAQRLRDELFEIVEATWLITELESFHLHHADQEGGSPRVNFTVNFIQYCASVEANLFMAIHALEPLARFGVGRELDGYLDGAIQEAGEADLLNFQRLFTSIYTDGERAKRVDQLNSIFRQNEPDIGEEDDA